jgi:hypothetical protein
MIQGDNFSVDMENPLLPVPYEPKLPAVREKRKYSRFRRKEIIKWDDFFRIERNEMVVFRVIPHASVSNNNQRLWQAIHKMYEMHESLRSRTERDGLKFRYREKDLFWFDVIFRQEDGKKHIEFYVSTSAYQAQKLKRRIENKMDVTIKEEDIKRLEVPKENTIIQELRYLNHDIFSLNTNSTEQHTPIAALLNTVDELLYDGDFARFSICNEVENRTRWMKNASWVLEKMQKGKVPQRPNLTAGKAAKVVKTGVAGVINEINSLLTDTFNAFSNLFFKSEKDFEKKKVIEKPFSLADEIKGKFKSHDKVMQGVFKSHIRVAAHSHDRLTRETIAETIASAPADLSQNNELHGIVVKFNGRRMEVIEELNTLKLSRRTQFDPNVNLVSINEMNKLVQMPTRELQRRYQDELSAKTRTETIIPTAVKNPKGLYLGTSEYKDQKIPVYLPTADKDSFYSGYAFVGKQGAGKDTAIQNFVYEGNTKHGISFFVLDWICEDGHRGMADGIRDLLPPENIIDLDYTNEDFIIPADLTEPIRKLGRKGPSRFAHEMIDFMELGELARSKKFLMDASKASLGSLSNIKKMIEDEEYRKLTIAILKEEGNLRLANDLENWGSNADLSNKADAILNRLSMFFGDDTLYDIFSQPPKKEVDYEGWMKEGKVVIVRIPYRVLGNACKVLAHWITLKVLMTRMLMSQDEKNKHGCFMIFNEPEQVASKGLANLMGRIATQGRKERLGSIFAFHHWNKLSDELQDNLIAGGVNQFLFANDHKKTFEKAEERLFPIFTVETALQTPKHHAIAILNTKEPLHPFLIHMAPPIPKDQRYDNSFLTKRHAQMFGRSWEELQRAL